MLPCNNRRLGLFTVAGDKVFSRRRPAVLNTLSLAAEDAGTHSTWRATVYSFDRTDLLFSQNWIRSVSLLFTDLEVHVSLLCQLIPLSTHFLWIRTVFLCQCQCGLVISLCHPLRLVSCNDRMGVDYATTLTQALLQVLASYSMQRFFQLPRLNSNSRALNSHSHPIPISWLILFPFPWKSHRTHGIPVFPIPMHTSSSQCYVRNVYMYI